MRTFFVAIVSCLFATFACAFAQTVTAAQAERSEFVNRLTEAAGRLPDAKQSAALQAIDDFSKAETLSDYSYGFEKAEPFLKSGGVEALLTEAGKHRGRLRYARVDALLAAGVYLNAEDPNAAVRLNAELLKLASRAEAFERVNYAHAAAELAAIRCDRAKFSAATEILPVPDAPRYIFWGARIDGDIEQALSLIDPDQMGDDTRDIRQAIDGYRLISDFGYCP